MKQLPSTRFACITAGLCLFLAWGGTFAAEALAEPLTSPALVQGKVPDEEIVQEFRRYFRRYKDTATRVEAVLALKGADTVGVLDVLRPVLADADIDVVDAAVRVLGSFKQPEPIAALALALAESKNSAERSGLLRAATLGRYALDAQTLQGCLADKDWPVRRAAAQALARSSTGNSAESQAALVALCSDAEVAVRCAALEELTAQKSRAVLAPAVAALSDPVWQVRSSAIHALGSVRATSSIDPLVQRMQVEEGRLLGEIGASLAELTGRDFGLRKEGWLSFWNTVKARFEIPTDEQLAKLRSVQQKNAEAYRAPGTVSYHGIETPSRSMLFVIDVSGSMENLAVEKERFQDGGYPSLARIDIVKTELARTIETLEPYVNFNILSFATETRPWKKGLVPANPLNKSSAIEWAKKLEAIGGNSNDDLARAGLVGSANLGAGKTNTFGALMWALGVAGRGARDSAYEVAVDTIFFLSDGRPSVGEFVDTNDILREVGLANELRKVVIHTIAIGEFEKTFMRTLAEVNGGVYVDLGR